jgi:hypothetical protein
VTDEEGMRSESMTRHPSAITGVVAPPVAYPDWFHAWVDANAPTIAAKAEEYGTNSLVEMGRIFARGQGREIEEREAVEIGCFLYVYGKVQRVADAMLKGKTPSFDTWSDTLVYASMAMFARETGRWP